uniref:Uncharacterized protein n=1 Tax=Varanus komodoensis TaxID=61221 RepID=A0A8D2KVC0_VARKO
MRLPGARRIYGELPLLFLFFKSSNAFIPELSQGGEVWKDQVSKMPSVQSSSVPGLGVQFQSVFLIS